jgi:hypothetical protein
MNWLSHETMLPNAVTQARILKLEYGSPYMGKKSYRDFAVEKCV